MASHSTTGCPTIGGTGSGAAPDRLATSHTPMVMASTTSAA